MKIRLTLPVLFILSLCIHATGQSAKLEGHVSDDKGARVADVRIAVTPGGVLVQIAETERASVSHT
jgi:hypothetical protein